MRSTPEPTEEEEAAEAEAEAEAASASKATSRIIGGVRGGRSRPRPRQVKGIDRELEEARAIWKGWTLILAAGRGGPCA